VTTGRLAVDAPIASRSLVAVTGEAIALPDPARLVHLQFRRFAGCPVCHLHLQTLSRRHAELVRHGVHEVVVFHTSAAELQPHATLPFALIADPDKQLYRAFGVEASPWALLDPRAWPAIVRGVARSAREIVRRRERPPALRPHGGRLGLPADFLIGQDGRVLACHYGMHADDQWSVDDVLARVPGRR
jgi:peroxiredoxin